MNKAVDDGEQHLAGYFGRNLVRHQIVVQRAILVKLCDQPQFGIQTSVNVVGRYEAEYVLVSEAGGVVDVALVLPRLLVRRVERLHGHELAAPLTFSFFKKYQYFTTTITTTATTTATTTTTTTTSATTTTNSATTTTKLQIVPKPSVFYSHQSRK